MRKLLLATIASSFVGVVNAQSAFDGPYIQLNVGGISSSVKSTYSENLPTIDSTNTGTSFVGQAVVGYSQSFSSFNLAANVFYNIGNQSVSDLNSARSSGTLDIAYKLKNTYGVSIEPGFNFNKETLGYLKLAYVSSSLTGTSTYTEPGVATETSTESKRFNGIGYGFGIKRMIDKNLFVGADAMYTQYQSNTDSGQFTTKPNQMTYMVGLGYKF